MDNVLPCFKIMDDWELFQGRNDYCRINSIAAKRALLFLKSFFLVAQSPCLMVIFLAYFASLWKM